LGVGHGIGENRLLDVIKDFFACPLIGGPETLAQADAAVLSLVGGTDLSVGDIQTCLSSLQQHFPVAAKVLVGAYADASLKDEVQLTGLVCRFVSRQQTESARMPESALVLPDRRAAGGKGLKKRVPPGGEQFELPLLEQALGIFSGSVPTPWNGENLDVPTFQRHGVAVDASD
jgi:cell division GTPase FtsZ